MFTVANIAQKNLLTACKYGFAGLPFGKKRVPTKSDLQKYDVVIVGAGLGNVLASHLDAVVQDKASIMIAYDNPTTEFTATRTLYEQGILAKSDISTSTKNLINKNNAHTEAIGVEKFNPDNNEIVLRNGRSIQYENLVIAMGQKTNYESIEGFDDAWADLEHSFYTNAQHPSWKITCNKIPRYLYNFNGGEAIFYIPPSPFGGEIENYNFLVTKSLWDWHAENGKISWETSKVTIINANNHFCRYFDRADNFFREQCDKRNINIQEGWTLVQVQREKNTAIFKNQQTGETIERTYSSLYSLTPYTTHSILADAGLAATNGYLDVNPTTLQHPKYDNIFGLGDVANLPTTKTFFGGLSQVHVLRHNLERKLNGLSMNASYNGHAEAPLYISNNEMTWASHNYDGAQQTLETSMASMRFKVHSKFGKKSVHDIMKFKNWGPPNYKFKKTFQAGVSTPVSAANIHPEQKTA